MTVCSAVSLCASAIKARSSRSPRTRRTICLRSSANETQPSQFESEDAEGIGQLTRVTFHPSYSYEDFVEGYKPVPTGTGQLDLRLTDGIFKQVCRTAQANPGQTVPAGDR